jgi:hypothetical protein
MTQQLTPNQKKWIKALRSGDYNQTTGYLHTDEGSCCLGVAAQEFIPTFLDFGFRVVVAEVPASYDSVRCTSYSGESKSAPEYVVDALGLYSEEGDPSGFTSMKESLVVLNDRGKSFNEIADILEANPEDYFNPDH